MNELRVPVKLEILQNSIGDLQKILNNLQPDTAGFKTLQKIIQSMTQESQKLAAQLSRPFTSENQFRTTEKTINKIEDSASRIQVVLDGLKFSDLKLTPDQQASFDDLNNQINTVRTTYQELVEDVKKGVMSNGDNANLLAGIPKLDALKASFTEIKEAVDNHVTELENSVEKQKAAFEKLKSNIELGSRATVLTSSSGGLTREALGDTIFDKFLSEKNGALKLATWNSGVSKSALMEAIEKEFQLEPGQLQALADKTLSEINQIFQSMGSKKDNPFKALINSANKGNQVRGQRYTELEEMRQQLEEYKRLQIELNQLQSTRIDPADTNAQARIAELKSNIDDLTTSILRNASASPAMRQPLAQIGSEAERLRQQLANTNTEFLRIQKVTQSFNQMKMAVVNFMGFTQVLNLTKRAIKDAINHIKELDTVMNKIAIVTKMSTSDLWNQVEQYSTMAQRYGTTIQGAYEVSQIYYQQGLETNEVLTLTNETLKLAKVSGLDYAQTTDYMTTAMRGFKMEISEASKVVDVYSNLAAHTAVTQEELAVAMSKTASSMESVGSTFEEASAMIGTMVAVTRESATNIGSALKSIAARYGEMKQDPLKLIDSEGEIMSYNKVDTALQSVGITLKDVDGQFRSFTDVIIELSEKWDQLESTQQRYIATQFAGNRQQSRFLALVSNADLLKSNLQYAEESEDTGTLQALKALDSIESKINQVQVAYQQFYTTLGFENVWKGFLDGAKNVINTLNRMPKLFGKIPVGAINAIASVIGLIKQLGLHLLTGIAQTFGSNFAKGLAAAGPKAKEGAESLATNIETTLRGHTQNIEQIGIQYGQSLNQGLTKAAFTQTADSFVNKQAVQGWLEKAQNATDTTISKAQATAINTEIADQMNKAGLLTSYGFEAIKRGGPEAIQIIQNLSNSVDKLSEAEQREKAQQDALMARRAKLGTALQGFGSALNLISMSINTTSRSGKILSGTLQAVAGVAIIAGATIKAVSDGMKTIPWVAIASGIIALFNGISMAISSSSIEAQLEEITAKAEELTDKAKELKANYRTYETTTTKLKELEKARYDSAEAADEYQNAVNDLAEKFPELISSFDDSGNAILSAVSMENTLTKAREDAAQAALAAAKAEKDKAQISLKEKQEKLSGSALTLGSVAERYIANNSNADYARNHDTGKQLTNSERTLFTAKELLETGTTDTEKDILKWVNENVKLATNENIIRTMLQELSENIKNGDYNEAAKLQNWVSDLYSLLNWDIGPIFSGTFEEIGTLLNEVAPMANSIISANKEIVNTWIRSSKYSELPIVKNAGTFDAVQQAIFSQAEDDFSNLHLEKLGQKILEPFNTLWGGLSSQVQEQINLILSHPEDYTATDLQNVFENAHIDESFIPDWIYNTFDQQNEDIRQALTNKANLVISETQREEDVYYNFLDMLQNENIEFTLNEQKFLVECLDQIAAINEAGFDSSEIMDAVNHIFIGINDLTAEARNAVLTQILENGFSTEGWKKTLAFITNNTELNFDSLDTSYIETIMNKTIPNYALAAASSINEIEDSWKDLDKFFSSAQKGVNKTEINSLIQQAASFGIELSEDDFIMDGENFILGASRVEGVISTYHDSLKSKIDDLIADLKGTYETLSKNSTKVFKDDEEEINQDFIEQDLENYQRILGADFNSYFKNEEGQWKAILAEGETYAEFDERVWQAVTDHYNNDLQGLQNVNDYYQLLFASFSKNLAWKRGDYSSLLETGLYESQEEVYARLIELASSISEMTEGELAQPDIKAAYTQVQKAYDELISDVLSKGFDNIDLHDYEGLLGANEETLQAFIKQGNYQEFVKHYAKMTGKTLDEVNEMLLTAIDKDYEKFSLNTIKSLDFIGGGKFTATSNNLKSFLNTFDLDLAALMKSKVIEYNKALNEYVVDYTKLDPTKFNADAIEGFNETVSDSVNKFFSDLAKLVESGLNGSLSNLERQTLQEYAERYNVDLEFDNSINGWELTLASTDQLLQKMRENDASIAETNKLVIARYNKEFEKYTADSIKDLTFFDDAHFAASGDELLKLADKFNLDLYDLFSNNIITYNDVLGEYVVDYLSVEGLKNDFEGIDNFHEIVQDSVKSFFDQIADLVKKALDGNLSHAESAKLSEYASSYGVGKISFKETSEGLKICTDSAIELYSALSGVAELANSITLDSMRENLEKTNEQYKSSNSTAGRVLDIQNKINDAIKEEAQFTKEQLDIIDSLKDSNVDIFNRPVINNPDGTISTLYTHTEEYRNYKPVNSQDYETEIPWVMNITPITPDGKELSENQLQEYIQKLVDETGGDIKKMKALDKKELGLIIEMEGTAGRNHNKVLQQYSDRAEALHNISDIIEKIKASDEFNDTKIKQYKEELALAQEIQHARAASEDKSFDFMSNQIPAGQNNPLTYFENWTKAFKVMEEAGKGVGKDYHKIAYQDFYNIITEMSNLAKISGQTFKLAQGFEVDATNAADLIRRGAEALSVTSDGTLKVDLSQLGIDFSAGAKNLKQDVGKGIKSVAESQIAMLDSMIQLLETIVAMEELGNIDVEGNGIDFGEMFTKAYTLPDGTEMYAWTQGMQEAAKNILASAEELGPDSDLYKGLESVKVNGTSMRKIFEDAKNGILVNADVADAYHAAVSAFYAAMQSGDYDLDNIMSSIKEVLAGTDFEGDIDVGDMHLTFHKGIVLERDKDGNYIVDGQKYDENHLDAALQAQAVFDLTTVQNAVKKYDPETGEVTYTAGEFKYTASYDVDSGLYEVHFSDGDSATSSSKDGINLAISTWIKKNALTQEELGSEAPENTTFTYTSHTGVTVDAEVDVKTGKIKFNTSDGLRNAQQDVEVSKIEESIRTVTAETAAAANAKLKESGETNSIEGTEITVKDPTVKLADGTELKLDLSGQKVTASNADIELENIEELSEKSPVEVDIDVDKSQEAYNKLRELQEETETLDNMHPIVDVDVNDYITDKIHTIQEAINSLQGKDVTVTTNYIQHGTPHAGSVDGGPYELTKATGNVGLAKAQGTLMGELGPELVVSNGRYFVAGQNGAEFVDLAEDAIVFNHLQTEQLLKHGMSSTRGAAVTNERNAVAFAQGNVNGGPAMASARAALAALKQLRAQWQAIANMGASDLAGLGGSGGGGGGGGDKNKEMKAFVKQLEIWYNWLQRIAVLEQKINYEEAKRSEINSSFHPDGEEYVKSQKKSLDYLLEQAAVEKSLYESQQKYFNERRKELNRDNGPFDQLYTFDEYGQLKYKDGALEKLSAISSRQDKYGNAKTAEQQYNEILALNPDFANYMNVDSSGNKLDKTQDDWYVQAVQNFWDKIDADQQEMQNLHDSIEEHKQNYLKIEEQKNEIMHEIEENQISLEKQVLAAIEESRQREIDELQKQRDAIQKASDNLINGLSQQLQKERDMYSQKESGEELTKLQRQLAILQRSGGSASQIAALQKEISQKQQDTYFELQQAQIDALQAASDAEIEKLDAQIDLMTETLEYEKLHGMLWDQVYQVLQGSPQEIANFIRDNTKSYWGQSPTELAKTVREDLFSAEKFLAQGKYLGSISEIVTKYDEEATKKKAEEEKKKEKEKKKKKDNSSSSSGGSSGTTTHSTPSSGTTSAPVAAAAESYVCNNDYTHAVYRNGTKVRDESHTGSTSCSKCGWVKKTTSPGGSIAAGIISGISAVKPSQKSVGILPGISMVKPPQKAAGGGYANHGIYELGEKGIETVLTAEQTQVLRNNILSNRPNSLISLLKTYNESYGNISHVSQELQNIKPESSESPVIIENASVNMNVTKMANDYDAQRAGEQALERMVQIARKTQGQNRIGR